MSKNIMQYESRIWATADLLIGAGIKQSDFPKFMMPFFALILVESRLLRLSDELRQDFEHNNLEDFIEEFKDQRQGYNEYLLRHSKALLDICKNDKTFDIDFDAYLKGFDRETQYLLGVDKDNSEEKFLDISGISGQLKKKNILFAFVKAWSEIDLKPFNNSEITTLEEHIKRKWADISAETAGEQYTPDDIIDLIAEIVDSKLEAGNGFLTIYDPACGGGNMLFGVEDVLNERRKKRPTKTFGQDWNDALYALAKIESRFRVDSDIRYGNSLTDIKFSDKKFNVVVANPPHGIPWKGFEKDIRNDKTERFIALPTVGDGQLLFMQHIVSQMDETNGIGVVVSNGSALFSGDAGSGESIIRKHLFDIDVVEALIQLPTDEFFNTNICTSLWVLNKKKPDVRKKKIMVINASDMFAILKKNKGKKRKEIRKEDCLKIVEILQEYQENEYAKIFEREYFYYNKQAIMLTNIDINGKSFEEQLPVKTDKKTGEKKKVSTIKLNPLKIEHNDESESIVINEFIITDYDKKEYKTLKDYYDTSLKNKISKIDYKENDLRVFTKEAVYSFDKEKETIIKEKKNVEQQELGCGKIIIKSSFKKATKTKDAQINISVELTPDYEKDYEIIPYYADEKINKKAIEDFMEKYVSKPFRYLENIIGCKINFNTIFYTLEKFTKVEVILEEIQQIDKEIANLESELNLC